jgi:hypothetical protein
MLRVVVRNIRYQRSKFLMELAGYIPMAGWNHLSYPETLDFIFVERV